MPTHAQGLGSLVLVGIGKLLYVCFEGFGVELVGLSVTEIRSGAKSARPSPL
jgi:hypothetical protein